MDKALRDLGGFLYNLDLWGLLVTAVFAASLLTLLVVVAHALADAVRGEESK